MSKPPPPSIRLRTIAALIRARPRVTVADDYAIGKWLIEAKVLIAHGGFAAWIGEHTGLTPDTASRAMLTAKRIRAPVELLRGVKKSAAAALAKKKVARSEELTERALSAPASKDGRIGLREMQSAISNVDPSAVHRLEDAKEGPMEALGRQIVAVAADETIDSVFLSFDRDEEELPNVSIVILGDGKRKSLSRLTIEGVFAAITGEEILTRCGRCKRDLMPSAFSRGSHNCKTCERQRVGEYTRKKRAEKRATKQRIEEMGT